MVEIEMSGVEAVLLYEDYQGSRNVSVKNQLLGYNRDNVMAWRHLALYVQDAFDLACPSTIIDESEIALLQGFYKRSRPKIRKKIGRGLDVELKFASTKRGMVKRLRKFSSDGELYRVRAEQCVEA